MRPILPLLALALAGSAPDRAHGQEPQTSFQIEADPSGAPCVAGIPEAGVVSVDDMIRQLQPVRPVVEVTVGRSIPGCLPLMSPLPKVARGHGTQHFDIQGWHADVGIPVEELGALFDEVYEYVSSRTGIRVDGLVPVTLRPAMQTACPFRGRAWSGGMDVFADSSWSREQWLGVFAHELGHVLQFRGSPGVSYLGGQFAQGYASWAGGRYWTDMQGYSSMHAAVRDYLERDAMLPLSTPAEFADSADSDGAADCIVRRDIVLTEWASLIEYLVESDGLEAFYARAEAALESGPGGVDYPGIFGRSFEQIEADWLKAIRAQR